MQALGCTRKGRLFMAKTISFCQGKGNLNHNNRKFITPNVDSDRIPWDIKYITESLEEAYDNCFGEALAEYNSKQKRTDRKKKDYLEEIRHSKNGEHVFYEDIVQIGTMNDTPVIDENGELTKEAKIAIEVLDEYAKTFKERNPNLYLFNCVMHLDEKTPHLHIDYIPVADGYSQGLAKRNSISKALQCMGIPKAISKKENEESIWKDRERNYLKELCSQRGIEIETLGIKRDNYSLPEYKEAMAKVDSLKEEADKIEQSVSDKRQKLEEYVMKEDALIKASEKADKEIEKLCRDVVPVTAFLSKEEYVKVPKRNWDKILQYSKTGLTIEKLSAIFEKKLESIRETFLVEMNPLKEKIKETEASLKKVFAFIKDQGMQSQYDEFARPKTVKEKLEIAQKTVKQISRKKEPSKDNRSKSKMCDTPLDL